MKQKENKSIVIPPRKVLVLCSRGVTSIQRHLMKDILSLLPHGKKDIKFDRKEKVTEINEAATLKNCSHVLYFESRKHKDLYLWTSCISNGPSAKLLVQNIHTIGELKFSKFSLDSRPLISFDSSFDEKPWSDIRSLLIQTFSVPPKFGRNKVCDRVFQFTVVDKRIWFRHYHIEYPKSKKDDPKLEEIGPRFVMMPIRIFSNSFYGTTIWQNESYISPNQVRASLLAQKRQRTYHVKEKKKKSKKKEQHEEEDFDFDDDLSVN